MLRQAHNRGVQDALARFKLAGPMGADAGVAPKGETVTHGTELIPYAKRDEPNDGTSVLDNSEAAANMPDWLWDNFTSYDRIAPGRADGTWGQEVIG